MELLQTTRVSKTSSGHNKSRDSISTQNNDLDDSVSLTENEPPLKKKDSKNYHYREKIRAINKVCGIHGTRFICQKTYSFCSTSRVKTW